MVIAGRRQIGGEPLWQCTTLLVLLMFELLVAVPVGVYLLHKFPDWSLMYLASSDALPFPDWALAGLYLLTGLFGYVAARVLVLRGRLLHAIGVVLGGVGVVAAVCLFGRRHLSVVGSTSVFEQGARTMPPIADTQLAFLAVAGLVAIVCTWTVSIWRLACLGRAYQRFGAQAAETLIRSSKGGVASGRKDKKPSSSPSGQRRRKR